MIQFRINLGHNLMQMMVVQFHFAHIRSGFMEVFRAVKVVQFHLRPQFAGTFRAVKVVQFRAGGSISAVFRAGGSISAVFRAVLLVRASLGQSLGQCYWCAHL